jgi:hypothetical protein
MNKPAELLSIDLNTFELPAINSPEQVKADPQFLAEQGCIRKHSYQRDGSHALSFC